MYSNLKIFSKCPLSVEYRLKSYSKSKIYPSSSNFWVFWEPPYKILDAFWNNSRKTFSRVKICFFCQRVFFVRRRRRRLCKILFTIVVAKAGVDSLKLFTTTFVSTDEDERGKGLGEEEELLHYFFARHDDDEWGRKKKNNVTNTRGCQRNENEIISEEAADSEAAWIRLMESYIVVM